jgi:membrane protein YdbS with pleckstrin-like domain
VVRHATIQTVSRIESPFDRRAVMAAIEVDTANSGAGGAAIRIPYLERVDADYLLSRLAYRAAATPFRW